MTFADSDGRMHYRQTGSVGVMLITGSTGAIGAATARLAVAAGWAVYLNYRSQRTEAEALAAELGGPTACGPGDVAVEDDVVTMFDHCASLLGVPTCLVNNAGVAPGYGPFVDVTLADIERTLAVNVTGALLCAREAARRMATSRGGHGGSIVNVSSRAAVIGGPGEWIHYAASKGALDSVTAGLSKELAPEGIRVNTVRPGLISADFGPWSPPGRTERLRVGVPMQRGGEPIEIAEAIVWLASGAASYVTGAFLDVGGGR